MSYMPPKLQHSFYINPVSALEIEQEIEKLSPSKATGPYSIPIYIFKLLKNILSKPLELIYNFSISNGIVPDCFKLARVIPVFKRGSQLELNNYRPISLLSVFNKILEKLIFKRLMSFIAKHELLYNKQFGFRQNHSTQMAILLTIDKIQKAIDEGT